MSKLLLVPCLEVFRHFSARISKKLIIIAQGKIKPPSVPNHSTKMVSGHFKAIPDAAGGHTRKPIELAHPPMAVQFVVDWISAGGKDVSGESAVLYPAGYRKSITSVEQIAKELQIPSLLARAQNDLKAFFDNEKTRVKSIEECKSVFCDNC